MVNNEDLESLVRTNSLPKPSKKLTPTTKPSSAPALLPVPHTDYGADDENVAKHKTKKSIKTSLEGLKFFPVSKPNAPSVAEKKHFMEDMETDVLPSAKISVSSSQSRTISAENFAPMAGEVIHPTNSVEQFSITPPPTPTPAGKIESNLEPLDYFDSSDYIVDSSEIDEFTSGETISVQNTSYPSRGLPPRTLSSQEYSSEVQEDSFSKPISNPHAFAASVQHTLTGRFTNLTSQEVAELSKTLGISGNVSALVSNADEILSFKKPTVPQSTESSPEHNYHQPGSVERDPYLASQAPFSLESAPVSPRENQHAVVLNDSANSAALAYKDEDEVDEDEVINIVDENIGFEFDDVVAVKSKIRMNDFDVSDGLRSPVLTSKQSFPLEGTHAKATEKKLADFLKDYANSASLAFNDEVVVNLMEENAEFDFDDLAVKRRNNSGTHYDVGDGLRSPAFLDSESEDGILSDSKTEDYVFSEELRSPASLETDEEVEELTIIESDKDEITPLEDETFGQNSGTIGDKIIRNGDAAIPSTKKGFTSNNNNETEYSTILSEQPTTLLEKLKGVPKYFRDHAKEHPVATFFAILTAAPPAINALAALSDGQKIGDLLKWFPQLGLGKQIFSIVSMLSSFSVNFIMNALFLPITADKLKSEGKEAFQGKDPLKIFLFLVKALLALSGAIAIGAIAYDAFSWLPWAAWTATIPALFNVMAFFASRHAGVSSIFSRTYSRVANFFTHDLDVKNDAIDILKHIKKSDLDDFNNFLRDAITTTPGKRNSKEIREAKEFYEALLVKLIEYADNHQDMIDAKTNSEKAKEYVLAFFDVGLALYFAYASWPIFGTKMIDGLDLIAYLFTGKKDSNPARLLGEWGERLIGSIGAYSSSMLYASTGIALRSVITHALEYSYLDPGYFIIFASMLAASGFSALGPFNVARDISVTGPDGTLKNAWDLSNQTTYGRAYEYMHAAAAGGVNFKSVVQKIYSTTDLEKTEVKNIINLLGYPDMTLSSNTVQQLRAHTAFFKTHNPNNAAADPEQAPLLGGLNLV